MKRLLTLLLAALLGVAAFAQRSFDEIAADSTKAGGIYYMYNEQPGPFLHQRRDPADMVKMPVGQQDRRDPPVPGLLPDPSRLIPGIDHDAFLFILLIQDIAAGLYDPHRQFVHSHKASLRSHDTGYPV